MVNSITATLKWHLFHKHVSKYRIRQLKYLVNIRVVKLYIKPLHSVVVKQFTIFGIQMLGWIEVESVDNAACNWAKEKKSRRKW
jgi:hypothetical protein